MSFYLLLAGWALWLSVGSPLGAANPEICPLFPSEHARFGVNVRTNDNKFIGDYDVAQLHAGWYMDYRARHALTHPANMAYLQTILPSLHYQNQVIDEATLTPVIDANPGMLWVLGNEPDSHIQDQQTPAQYAVFYHDLYAFLKARDPTAQIAPAGVVQPTPIRLRYLDAILDAYRQRYGAPMPVDVWTVHGFILQERLNDWGAGIPVGLEAYAAEGRIYTMSEHSRLDIFQQQIRDFRRWMAARGYRNRPLILTEYGILLPDFYGFTDKVVINYMLETFRFLQAATDPAYGYPRDGNRLVQQWGWYSLNDREYDAITETGFNGNLFDHDTGVITEIGKRFAEYTAPLVDTHTNLAVAAFTTALSSFVPVSTTTPVTFTATIVNGGSLPATVDAVRFYRGDPAQGGILLATRRISAPLAPGCRAPVALTVPLSVGDWPPGPYPIYVVVVGADPQQEKTLSDNQATSRLRILATGEAAQTLYLPAVTAHID